MGSVIAALVRKFVEKVRDLPQETPWHRLILPGTFVLGFRDLVFGHPEPNVFTRTALFNDFSAVMGYDTSDLVELVRFDYELKRFSRRQYSET